MATTEQRSKWAGAALRAYLRAKKERGQDEADLRDLLADLMHYAANHDVDFQEEFETARRNYDEESRRSSLREGHKLYVVHLVSDLPIFMAGMVELPLLSRHGEPLDVDSLESDYVHAELVQQNPGIVWETADEPETIDVASILEV